MAREGEAPAEPTVQRFGRSLTLPSNEFVVQAHKKHVYSGGLTLPSNDSVGETRHVMFRALASPYCIMNRLRKETGYIFTAA